jgi:hypothetical protein
MMDTEVLPRVDFRNIGSRMARDRYQRGSLKKVGKTRQEMAWPLARVREAAGWLREDLQARENPGPGL